MKYQWFHKWDLIECPDASYCIGIEDFRLHGLNFWTNHLAEKRWFNYESFMEAYKSLNALHSDIVPLLRLR